MSIFSVIIMIAAIAGVYFIGYKSGKQDGWLTGWITGWTDANDIHQAKREVDHE